MTKLERLIAELCPNGVEFVPLGEVADFKYGYTDTAKEKGAVRFIRITDIGENGKLKMSDSKYIDLNGESEKYLLEKGDLLMARTGATYGKTMLFNEDISAAYASFLIKIRFKNETVLPNFYWHFAQSYLYWNQANKLVSRAGQPQFNANVLKAVTIPMPPLAVQKEIVRILDTFTELTAELTARKKQYQYYRDELLTFDDYVPVVVLGNIGINLDSKRKPVTKGVRESGEYPYYGASGIVDYVSGYIFDGDFLLISEDGANLLARNTPIAFSASGKIWVNNHAHVLQFETYVERRFIEFYLNAIDLIRFISTAAQPKLSQENLNKIPIPQPSLEEQARIVDILDRFDTLVNDITSGLPAEIAARKKQYEYYRDKLLKFEGARV